MAHLSRSRAATLGRTGDTSDAGGEAEHRILASAEQSLLASLAKQRISNATAPPKIFAKTVLRSPDDPTFQGAHFGDGASQTWSIGSESAGSVPGSEATFPDETLVVVESSESQSSALASSPVDSLRLRLRRWLTSLRLRRRLTLWDGRYIGSGWFTFTIWWCLPRSVGGG